MKVLTVLFPVWRIGKHYKVYFSHPGNNMNDMETIDDSED